MNSRYSRGNIGDRVGEMLTQVTVSLFVLCVSVAKQANLVIWHATLLVVVRINYTAGACVVRSTRMLVWQLRRLLVLFSRELGTRVASPVMVYQARSRRVAIVGSKAGLGTRNGCLCWCACEELLFV